MKFTSLVACGNSIAFMGWVIIDGCFGMPNNAIIPVRGFWPSVLSLDAGSCLKHANGRRLEHFRPAHFVPEREYPLK